MKKDHYLGALLEDIDSKLDALVEGQSLMATKAQLRTVDERLTRVESDLQIIKQDIGEHHKWLRKHDLRLDGHDKRFAKLKIA